jgi:hypothetical protein
MNKVFAVVDAPRNDAGVPGAALLRGYRGRLGLVARGGRKRWGDRHPVAEDARLSKTNSSFDLQVRIRVKYSKSCGT